MHAVRRPSALLAAALLLVGCQSTYYAIMETFGVEKREILADEVRDGREDTEAAKEQFVSALDEFRALTSYQGGELEAAYERLSGEFERCEDRAEAVSDRIESIERVAGDLFEEWSAEISQISRADMQRKSRDLLEETQDRYAELIAAMKKAERSMEPVLAAFRDQVLLLKHNLNAQVIASLQDDVIEIEDDVAGLVADMEASIAEADAFLSSIES